jgi:hypothetical protein
MQRSLRVSIILVAVAALLTACDANNPVDPGAEDASLSAARSAKPQILAPSSLTAVVISSSQINISWTDNSGNETLFEVYRSLDGVNGTFSFQVPISANLTGYEDRSLGSPAEFCYRVRAVHASRKRSEYSDFSNTACASTVDSATPPQPVPSAVPSNVSALVESESVIRISWQDNSSDESGFSVAMHGYNPFAYVGPDVVTLTYGFTPGAEYCFEVKALRRIDFSNGGWIIIASAASDTACTMIPLPTEPPAAYVISASPFAYGNLLTLTWDHTLTRPPFRSYRSTNGGSTWTEFDPFEWSWNSLYDSQAIAESTTCYHVVAFNMAGPGAPSNTACATLPSSPTSLVAVSIPGDSLELTWSDNSAVEQGYRVMATYSQGSPDNAGVTEWDYIVTDLPANSTRWRTPRLDPPPYTGITYYIVATSDGGTSAGTNSVSATSVDQ